MDQVYMIVFMFFSLMLFAWIMNKKGKQKTE